MDFLQTEVLQFVIKMIVAFLLALPIAWNRERHTRIMGLRTFPLVALGSTAYVLVSLSILRDDPDAQARIIQGLITGIGFVGGGAILKDPGGSVQGTATAVSVWTTGALGISVAYGRCVRQKVKGLFPNNQSYSAFQ